MRQDPEHPTGIDDEGRPDSNSLRARNRKANAALQLHIAGMSLDEIASSVGYPDGGAVRVAIELALERELHEESRTEMRKMAGMRLQRLTKAVWAKAIDPNSPDQMAAVREARANLAEYAKVFGLYAPSEMVVHTPTTTELENWVAAVVGQSVPQLAEADIFEGEVVEDSDDVEITDSLPVGDDAPGPGPFTDEEGDPLPPVLHVVEPEPEPEPEPPGLKDF